MTQQHEDYEGWEREEAVDFGDYLEDLGPDRVEVRYADGSISYWTMSQLREVLGLPPEAPD